LSIRKSRYTNIKGERVEFSAEIFKREDRHFLREARTQKAFLEDQNGVHIGTRNDVKRPIKRKGL
jgi:hypothetical protein